MIDVRYELDQLDENPEWLDVLETYDRLITTARKANPESEGWVTRLHEVDGVETEDLSFIHGNLIAHGFLRFQIADRNSGMEYQLSQLGKRAVNRTVVEEAVQPSVAELTPVEAMANDDQLQIVQLDSEQVAEAVAGQVIDESVAAELQTAEAQAVQAVIEEQSANDSDVAEVDQHKHEATVTVTQTQDAQRNGVETSDAVETVAELEDVQPSSIEQVEQKVAEIQLAAETSAADVESADAATQANAIQPVTSENLLPIIDLDELKKSA